MDDVSLPRTHVALAGSDDTDSTEPTIDPLFAEHFALVWRLLRRWGLSEPDADDAAQQVFMIAARKIERIAPDRARQFLYGVAVRVARNARRGLHRRREVLGDPPDVAHEHGPEHHAELHNAWALLDELLAELPDDLRRVLVLAEIEQFEVPEIAEFEGIPVGTAASRLRRARASFREVLERAKPRSPFGGEP